MNRGLGIGARMEMKGKIQPVKRRRAARMLQIGSRLESDLGGVRSE